MHRPQVFKNQAGIYFLVDQNLCIKIDEILEKTIRECPDDIESYIAEEICTYLPKSVSIVDDENVKCEWDFEIKEATRKFHFISKTSIKGIPVEIRVVVDPVFPDCFTVMISDLKMIYGNKTKTKEVGRFFSFAIEESLCKVAPCFSFNKKFDW